MNQEMYIRGVSEVEILNLVQSPFKKKKMGILVNDKVKAPKGRNSSSISSTGSGDSKSGLSVSSADSVVGGMDAAFEESEWVFISRYSSLQLLSF